MKNTVIKASTVDQHKLVLRIAGPIILANLSVPLLGAVDTAVIGHLSHAYYLASVAIGATFIHFVYWGFGFLRMGTSGLTAQSHGANQGSEITLNLIRPLILSAVFGLLIWLLHSVIINIGLSFFQTTEKINELVRIYFNIRIISAPAVLINYCLIGWFIGVKDTRATLIIQLWMNTINITLDIIFVLGFICGVEGVAWATVLAETSAMILGFYLFLKKIEYKNFEALYGKIFVSSKFKRMISISFDIFIRTFCLMFAFAYFTREASSMGEIILASNAILLQFIHFLSFGLDGFAHASETLVGNAIGAKNKYSFWNDIKTCMFWALLVSITYSLTYWFFFPTLFGLLTNIPEVKTAASEMKIWLAILPLIAVWPYILDGIFIGATQSRELRNAMIISLIIFFFAIHLLKPIYTWNGIWIALIIFMLARGVTLIFFFPKLISRLEKVSVTYTK